jgi:hypothetical protein
MKRLLFLIAVTLATVLSSPAFAIEWPGLDSWTCNWDSEFRIAAFRPSFKRFRNIYGKWGTEYSFEASKSLCECYNLYGWGSVGYMTKDGHSIVRPEPNYFHHHRTRISMVPLNFGLKYMPNLFSCLDSYIGVGASCKFVRIRDHDSHLHRHTQKAAWGVVVKSGLRYNLWDCSYIDLFADYTYQRLSPHSKHHQGGHRHSVNVGGVSLGGGIGLSF